MNCTYPLVSIIVPTYNHSQFVLKCLDSILADDYINKELIIIDDGSKDDTAQKIEQWHNKNQGRIAVKFLRNHNNGVSKTLNLGLSMAEGIYILPIASDDLLHNNSIRSRVAFLEKNRQYEAVFGDCLVIDDNGAVTCQSGIFGLHGASKDGYLASSYQLAYEIIWQWSIPGPVLMYRKDYMFSIGKYNENRKVEDWDLYLRMAATGKIAYIDESVSCYRVHDHNASRNSLKRIRKIHCELLKTALANRSLFQGQLRYLIIKKAVIIVHQLILSYLGKKI